MTDGTRLVRIDVKAWGSPVAKQYSIRRLPQVWLYDGTEQTTTHTNTALNILQE